MILTQINIDTTSLMSSFDSFIMWSIVLVGVIALGLIMYWLYTITTYNVQVELLRQVGETYDDDGKKKINYRSDQKVGKIYQKKLKSGGFKEYFRIKGTNWDYLNFFSDQDFYMRKPSGILDFKKLGIKLFMDQKKGLVPLRLSNPGFTYADTSLNEVIGAITDSLHEREMLYGNDFWSKYGNLITVASLMAFFVIGMIFLIKYQDVFWENSMNGLRSTIEAVKQVSAQNLA